MERLKREGMEDDVINKILKKHDKEMAQLAQAQDAERQNQQANFQVTSRHPAPCQLAISGALVWAYMHV